MTKAPAKQHVSRNLFFHTPIVESAWKAVDNLTQKFCPVEIHRFFQPPLWTGFSSDFRASGRFSTNFFPTDYCYEKKFSSLRKPEREKEEPI